MKQPLGVILAGGQATRMGGGDKGLRLLGIADSLDGFNGPLAGVLAGLDWAAAQGAETIVTAAADTPFFPCDLVPQLLLASEGMTHPLVLAATPDAKRGRARHPTFGLWPVALRDDLRAALGGGLRKVVLWTQQHGGREALFPQEAAFFNVNTPEDLAQAETML